MGLTSFHFAVLEKWELAVAMVIAAGIVDGLDGRVARVLKASSDFGAQLDSLSDFVCFGVAPPTLLYLWTLHEVRGVGWAVTLLVAVCMALRLARYNVSLGDTDRPQWMSYYFAGLPAPSAAGVTVLPMMLSFLFGDAFFREPVVVGIYAVGVALLIVSTIPMYSGKGIKIRHEHVLPVLLLVGVMFAAIVGYFWWTFSLLAVGYLISIPFSVRSRRRHAANEARLGAENASSDEELENP